ncbi:MAG: hypothetical protein Q8P59_02520, partial [Dehalococcoidia bacterium]|nr:hypothetical protein [Dehalococcoidia bacterium]
GAVDAGYVTNVQHNVLLPLDGKGFTFLGDAGQEIRMGTGGLATSTVTIRSQKDLLQKVLRAVVKAQRFVMDPTKAEKSTDYLTEWSKQDRSAAEVVVKDYILGKGILWKDGLMSDEALKTTIAFSREALKITAEFQADQLFDTSFAKAAAQEMDSKGWKP